MNKLATILIEFFRHFELLETETAFRKEIKGKHIILDDKDYEIYLSSLLRKSARRNKENLKNAQKKIKKMKSVAQIKLARAKNLSEQETEDIMENLMNRLFSNYNIFGESKLNSDIEKVFENRMFQKLYNDTDVLKEAFEDSEQDGPLQSKALPRKSLSLNRCRNKVLESQLLGKNEISINQSFHESHFMPGPLPEGLFRKKTAQDEAPLA